MDTRFGSLPPTGFDAPCLRTMYADKPMQGHGLMQAIARVNRVFRDKEGGLVLDYLGLSGAFEFRGASFRDFRNQDLLARLCNLAPDFASGKH